MRLFFDMFRLIVFIFCLCVCLISEAQNTYSIDPQEVDYVEPTPENDGIGGKKSVISYVPKSVLSEGRWVKVRINSSGMKRLTKAALSKMGFADISAVSVYGNGGFDVPHLVSGNMSDDLKKLSVYRTDDAVLFYARDSKRWSWNINGSLSCEQSEYDTYTYYYITDSQKPSVVPDSCYSATLPVVERVSDYNYRLHHELHSENLLLSGQEWYGESISGDKPTKVLSFTLPKRGACDSLFVTCDLIGRSGSVMKYKAYYNDVLIYSGQFDPVNTSSTVDDYATYDGFSKTVIAKDKERNELKFVLSSNSSSDYAWIDKVTITSRSDLDMTNVSDLIVCNAKSNYVDYGDRLPMKDVKGSLEYNVSGADASYVVWKVDDYINPVVMPTTFSDGKLRFVHDKDKVVDFVIFNPNGSIEEPEVVGVVENQNLHGLPSVNYVIVYHPDFKDEAERLAELHRRYSNISVATVNVEHIYNEFSCGKAEPAAIRNFLSCIYRKGLDGGDELRNVLLFGDGSYDNMSSPDNTSNKIPTYQSKESLIKSDTYVTDDFYGWLKDDMTSVDVTNKMVIGVGRFPVQTKDEAKAAVDKSETYLSKADFGAWKNAVLFVADDGDKCEHIKYADSVAKIVEEKQPDVDVKRIFMEMYAPERSSTGIVYPKAHEDFMKSINEGCLVLNYVGHGGYNALSDEGLYKHKHIEEWTNKGRLPFFITATCDFCPFDDNHLESSGEKSFLYPHGGFIGLFTTTRLVYGSSNNRIHKALYDFLLETNDDGRRYTIGEASFNAKLKARNLTNSLKYVLIGDPALTLDFGTERYVATEEINGQHIDICDSPIAALKTNVVKGSIRNADNSLCDSFNGQVMVTLYDKRATKIMTGPVSGSTYTYEDNGNILYSGMVPVKGGSFDVSFILSKDIDFEVGYGRLSYYAYSVDSVEASGSLNTVLVGGVSDNISDDGQGPEITMWIDYPEFSDGGNTGPNPIVYARISDESGINTSGLGVGHNISICIDNDRENAINANDFFSYDVGSFTSGMLEYQLPTLPDGHHVITLKAWDNINNSSIKEININSSVHSGISFGTVELFPQPYFNESSFKLSFSHNSGAGNMDITMRLYALNGQQLAQSSATIAASGSRFDDIDVSSFLPSIKGLSSGIYFLNVDIRNNGRKGVFTKKIIIKAQ